jgi:hypothetical protein
MADNRQTVTIEDAQLIFKNFAGKEGQFNAAGNREFSVLLDPETATRMERDGWNIKYLKPREEGDEPVPYLPVSVSFKVRPPRIVMMSSTARTQLDEDSCEVLDWADIEKSDLIVTPYEWSVNGKTGIKAYLKSLFVMIAEDDLERKYRINEAG